MQGAGLKKMADVLDGFVDRVGRLTGWCAFALVLVMSFNVLLRYMFRTGSVGMQELEWHLMAPICMLGLSYAILHDGHVKVDILYGRFSYRTQKIIDFISMVLVVAVVAILLWLSIPYVEQSYNIGEKSPDPGGLTHRWIVKAMLPLGFALLLVHAIASVLRAYIDMLAAFRGEGPPAAPASQIKPGDAP